MRGFPVPPSSPVAPRRPTGHCGVTVRLRKREAAMARRPAGQLTVAKAKALVAKGAAGRHADGGNLYLHVAGPGRAL